MLDGSERILTNCHGNPARDIIMPSTVGRSIIDPKGCYDRK